MSASLVDLSRLAFVDVETTGLGAEHHRIAEIGVVTLDSDSDGVRIAEWETLLDPGRRVDGLPGEFGAEPPYFCAERRVDDAIGAPQFGAIARSLGERLDGRLLIAHNARFDHAFLKAAFARAGVAFAPKVVCSLMLSRRLFPQYDCHDLDALCGRHAVPIETRHRALADARLLQRCWSSIAEAVGRERMAVAIAELLADPLLPGGLDLETIDALPERPGVFAFVDADDRPLLIGRAGNLRRHVRRYFHLDRHCARADGIARRLKRIRWELSSGPLDARLRQLALERALGDGERPARPDAFAIRIDPARIPAATIVAIHDDGGRINDAGSAGDGEPLDDADRFGVFTTARKARNALARLSASQRICPTLLGLEPASCRCSSLQHTRHLIDLTRALSPQRLQRWPFAGPIAIRERQTLHVFDRWEHLASVRTLSDAHAVLEQRRNGFDADVHVLLTRWLPRIKPAALRVMVSGGVASASKSRSRAGDFEPESV